MELFRYDDAVLERFPTIVGGIVRASGVTNGPAPPELTVAYRDEQRAAIARIGDTSLGAIPSLAAWRRTFSAFGVEPTRYRSAAEALLRRLTKQGELPSLGALVDLGNLVSIRYALPVAVVDRRGVEGTIVVRLAEGNEPFADLGSDGVEHPEPGEIVFVDHAGVVCARRWCWRQSAGSAARADTTDVLITVEGHHEDARADVAAAMADLERLLGGATVASALLSASDPAFVEP